MMTLSVAPDKGQPGVLLELAPTVPERFSSGEYVDDNDNDDDKGNGNSSMSFLSALQKRRTKYLFTNLGRPAQN